MEKEIWNKYMLENLGLRIQNEIGDMFINRKLCPEINEFNYKILNNIVLWSSCT